MVGSWSDRSRIILGSVAHWKWRFTCFQLFSVWSWVVILRGRRSIWWGWRVLPVAPRIVNDVSSVMWLNHDIMRGRRNICWGWRVLPVAPRIVNDVSSVMWLNHDIHYAWQAQYLVRLEGVACCSAHCKWRFICDVAQSWHSLCVAGAVFGEVGGCCLLLRAL